MRRNRLFVGGMIAANAPPLVFVHIQKTAGMAFRAYLAAHFGPGDVAASYVGLPGTLEAAVGKRFVAGHFPLARALPLFQDAFFVTLLRDPVARVQSQYRSFHDPAKLSEGWRQRLSEAELRDIQFVHRATFEEFVLSDRETVRGHIDNLQTQVLADSGLSGSAALESAMRNLKKRIAHFGIQERFAESIALFRAATGSDRPFAVPEVRWNRSRPVDLELSARGRARLAELVSLDVPLYQAARRLFEARLWRHHSIWQPLRRVFLGVSRWRLARLRPAP